MAKVTGARLHAKRLKRMAGPELRREVGKAVYAAADIGREIAHRSIAEGAIQGAGHVPSRPGEPPNWDTGQLATNIVTAKTGELSAEISSNAPYSADLEFGTSKMAERPFMRPMARKMRPQAEVLVERAVRRATKR